MCFLVNGACLVQKMISQHAILHQTFLPPIKQPEGSSTCFLAASEEQFHFIIYSTTLVNITTLPAVAEPFFLPTHHFEATAEQIVYTYMQRPHQKAAEIAARLGL